MTKWVSVKIPRKLARAARRYLVEKAGYPSLSNVATDGVRRLLEAYGFLPERKGEGGEDG